MFLDGKFDIGYELNGKKFYVIRCANSSKGVHNAGALIGAHGCSYNNNSRFIYKTASYCEGFFIRKKNWVNVMEFHSYVCQSLL